MTFHHRLDPPTDTADAVVADDGHDLTGRDEISASLTGATGEFTYTAEFTSATTVDTNAVDVLQDLEGDFPGWALWSRT